MPQVTVRYRGDLAKKDGPYEGLPFKKISEATAQIVAEELTCEDAGGAITEKDVEVEFKKLGQHDRTNSYAITFQIDANDFPARRSNLAERTSRIAHRLARESDWWRFARSYVWVRLLPAAFEEIKRPPNHLSA